MTTTALAAIDLETTGRQIAMLAEYFNYELQPHVLRVYVDGLADIPTAHMKAACRRVIQTQTFMPKVAELRQAVDDIIDAQREEQRRRGQVARQQVVATEFAMVGRVPKAAVVAKFGRLTAPEMCACVACGEAGVTGPPRLVPGGFTEREGESIEMGVWLHGYELKEHERGQAAFESAMRSVFARYRPEEIA